MSDEQNASAKTGAQSLRAVRDPNPFAALGRAVSYMMTKPSFAAQPFGVWSKTLTGQVNRGHYFLVTDGSNIVGFAGWAMVDEDHAKAWLEGRGDLQSKDCINGDCMVINAWAANNESINRFILKELRKYTVGRRAVYAKRYYADGSVRPLRVAVTPALVKHITVNR